MPIATPERLTVPTCIGCGAMGQFGTCDTGCSEQKLELIRAAAHDSLAVLGASAHARAEALRSVAAELARHRPAGEDWEGVYRALQDKARANLHRHQRVDGQDVKLEERAEPATTWWCAKCGGIDAPQPCLGICVWRSVDWVNRAVYEHRRERVRAERKAELGLRRLLRRLASVTPRDGQWARGWRVLQAEAQEALRQSPESSGCDV
jgi:hypothetical protein